MELAIIGGLAALGMLNYERKQRPIMEPIPEEYRLPEDARYIYNPRHARGMDSMENPRVSMYLSTNSYQQPNINNLDYARDRETEKVIAMSAAASPIRSDMRAATMPVVRGHVGPIRLGDGPPTAPYFTSNKTQFHSNENSSRRVESFTGKDPLERRTAHDTPGPLFQPTPNVNTGRDMLVARDAQLSHVPTSIFRANEAPMPSENVGPGIGLAPGEAPSGGLHPFLRILPDNVGQYRNNLPGGVIPGGQPISEGQRRYAVVPSHKAAKTSTDYERERPGLPSSAPYVGRSLRPDVLSTMQEQSRSMPIANLPGIAGNSAMNAPLQRFDAMERDGRPRNVGPNAYFESAGGANFAGPRAPGPYAKGDNTHLAWKREVPLGEHGYINEASVCGKPIGSIGTIARPRSLRQVSDGYYENAANMNATRHATAANRGEARKGVQLRGTLRSTNHDGGYAGNAIGSHTKQIARNGEERMDGGSGRPVGRHWVTQATPETGLARIQGARCSGRSIWHLKGQSELVARARRRG